MIIERRQNSIRRYPLGGIGFEYAEQTAAFEKYGTGDRIFFSEISGKEPEKS